MGSKGPGKKDIANLAFLCKTLGTVLVILSVTFTFRFSNYGLIGVFTGSMFIILGIGLGKFRMWAWYLGVGILVPINLITGIIGLLIFQMGALSIVAVAMILAACFVFWVLLSKGGRKRYKAISAAIDRRKAEAAGINEE